MYLGVLFVVCTKIRISFVQPRLLLFGSLKVSSHTNAHSHVAMDDVLGLLNSTGDCKAMLVHPVQVAENLPEFIVSFDVREVNLSQTAGLEVLKALLGARIVTHERWGQGTGCLQSYPSCEKPSG